MADINLVMIEGKLHGEPDVRKTAKGFIVTTFKIQHQSGYTDGKGVWRVKPPQIIEVTLFGSRGEGAVSQFSEGDHVIVEGTISSQEYKERYYTKVVANNVIPRGKYQNKEAVIKPTNEVETPDPDAPSQKVVEPHADDDSDLPF